VSLFEAEAARDAAMAQVLAAANLRWLIAAQQAVHRAALELRFLTSDDVMERIDPNARTHELRALGPVMTHAAKAGWIEKANLPGQSSRRRSLHASPRTVWRSLIYDPSYRFSPQVPQSPSPSDFLPDTEGALAMPLQLTITAQSLEELWNTLSTFPQLAQTLAVKDQQEGAGQGFVPADTASADTSSLLQGKPNGEIQALTENVATIASKRGPGRPPGSTNKPKAAAVKEPEPEATEDDPDDAEMEGAEDEVRAAITAELGKFWKKGPGFKNIIQGFRSQLGISTMLELQAKDFPKARALIEDLKAASD
jgi:hypothetical protein